MERYLLQTSTERENWLVATDTIAGIVVKFEKGKFNETQKVTLLDNVKYNHYTATDLAVAIRNLTDWLVANHSEVLQE
jgi:hypothetical protein|nr:MAG TPA: hypothetical protein [Caudoviricetes sp.]